MPTYTLKSLMTDSSSFTAKMTEEKIQEYVLQKSDLINCEPGYLFFEYCAIKMELLWDKEHDRMRIIAPITQYSRLAPSVKESLMYANFDRALDARYAVYEDSLYACFVHPLASLRKEDLFNALEQVKNLKSNFGKTYSSAQLSFTRKK